MAWQRLVVVIFVLRGWQQQQQHHAAYGFAAAGGGYNGRRRGPTTTTMQRVPDRNFDRTCPWPDIRGGATITNAPTRRLSTTELMVANPGLISLVAGSAAGAIGVGVAFPFDTVKTKAQVMARTRANADGSASIEVEEKTSLFKLIALIWEREGWSGFFGGVKGMMAGQAVIKAVAFAANANMLLYLQHHYELPATVALLAAACFAGFVTSFLVAPIERIKLMLQAQSAGTYANELECFRAILKSEGWTGLLTRGLGVTLSREIPSYGLYFWIYGVLMSSTFGQLLPATLAPLLFGGLSGMASWLPVYPVDVVKTTLQNTESSTDTAWDVMRDLYAQGGVGAFFDGLDAKMLRAAVNHAVTFFVYDMMMRTLSQ